MTTHSHGPYAAVTEEKSLRAWTVSVLVSGQNLSFAVFRTRQEARSYADPERRRFGLPPVYGSSELA